MHGVVFAIIVTYFVGMFALGILGRQRTKNITDYYVAGRQIKGFFVGIAYISSLVSAGALVGWVSQTWQWGIYFIYSACAVTLATFLCWWLLGRKLMRLSRTLDLVTVPDFVEARFHSRYARLLASIVLIAFSIPLLVTQFMAIGLLFQVTTGLSYHTAVIAFGGIVFLYVASGGYFAIIYTDVAQGIILILGILILFVACIVETGGFPIEEYCAFYPAGAASWPGADAATTPNFLISFVLLTFFGALGAPNNIRNFYSMKNTSSFRQGFTIVISIVVPLEIIIVMLGLYGRILFPAIDTADNIIFYMIEVLLTPFGSGVALVALAAAIMSTVDSLLIQCASTVENDILTKAFGRRLTENRRMRIAQITVGVVGIICILWSLDPPAFLALLMYPAWGAMGLTFAWIFFLGLYWRRFNKAGAITAMLTSPIVFTVWNVLGNPFGIYHIQMALMVSIPASLAATLLTPPTEQEVLSKFFSPRQHPKHQASPE